MRKWMQWCSATALVAGVGLVALGAQAEGMFTWTTEDGVHAYTDDPKKVPARYEDQAEIVRREELDSYDRYTPKDATATERYAQRLTDRLEHLRALNAEPQVDEGAALPAALSGLSIGAGGNDLPRLNLATQGDAPLVIEPIMSKRAGDVVTRRATVVRQGDRTLAIVKGERHHRNPIHDVIDERELEE